MTVHPHMRGDDPTWWVNCFISTGSPPHAWGRRVHGSILLELQWGHDFSAMESHTGLKIPRSLTGVPGPGG